MWAASVGKKLYSSSSSSCFSDNRNTCTNNQQMAFSSYWPSSLSSNGSCVTVAPLLSTSVSLDCSYCHKQTTFGTLVQEIIELLFAQSWVENVVKFQELFVSIDAAAWVAFCRRSVSMSMVNEAWYYVLAATVAWKVSSILNSIVARGTGPSESSEQPIIKTSTDDRVKSMDTPRGG